ncbi:MAG: hypothetical protein IJ733_00350 [Lachnospiraceae bacterium]|nr:hypothetical protein [Lachnospiraceae bacterium]
MNIREEYRLEMEHVKPSSVLNDVILEQADLEGDKRAKMRKRKQFVSIGFAAAALVIVILTGANFHDVKAFASSLFGNFTLWAGKEQIEVGELEPVSVDFGKFVSQEGTHLVDGSTDSYYHNYSSLEEMEEQTGLHLWDSKKLPVSLITLELDIYGQGELSCEFKDGGECYQTNGMFMIKEREKWGYGTEEEFYRTYTFRDSASGEERKAYFVKKK